MIFEYDTKACGGCRTCEMACSYHHRGIFCPSISSLQIVDRPEKLGFAVSLASQNKDGRLACDGCKGLEIPLCIKYCSPLFRDELKEILKNFQINR